MGVGGARSRLANLLEAAVEGETNNWGSHLARSASRLALGFLILFFRQLFLLFIAARLRPGVLQQLLLDQ